MSTLASPDTDTLTDTSTDIDDAFGSIIENEQSPADDEGDDHERMSHYVSKEDIVRAATTGAAVYALCGKKWTPRRNPDNFPVCQTCKDVYEQMESE